MNKDIFSKGILRWGIICLAIFVVAGTIYVNFEMSKSNFEDKTYENLDEALAALTFDIKTPSYFPDHVHFERAEIPSYDNQHREIYINYNDSNAVYSDDPDKGFLIHVALYDPYFYNDYDDWEQIQVGQKLVNIRFNYNETNELFSSEVYWQDEEKYYSILGRNALSKEELIKIVESFN